MHYFIFIISLLLHSALSCAANEEEFSLIGLSAKTDSSLSQPAEREEPAIIASMYNEPHNEPPVMQRARHGYVMSLSGSLHNASQHREVEEPMIIAPAHNKQRDDAEGPDSVGSGSIGRWLLFNQSPGNPDLCATVQKIIGDASVPADAMDVPRLSTLNHRDHRLLMDEIKARVQALKEIAGHDTLFWQQVDEIREAKKKFDEDRKKEPAPRLIIGRSYCPPDYLAVEEKEIYGLLKNGYTPPNYLQQEYNQLETTLHSVASESGDVHADLRLRLQAVTFVKEHRPEQTATLWRHLDSMRTKIAAKENQLKQGMEIAQLMRQIMPDGDTIFPAPEDAQGAVKKVYIDEEGKRLLAINTLLQKALCVAAGKKLNE